MYGVMKRKRRISQDLNLMFGIIKIMFDELQNIKFVINQHKGAIFLLTTYEFTRETFRTAISSCNSFRKEYLGKVKRT